MSHVSLVLLCWSWIQRSFAGATQRAAVFDSFLEIWMDFGCGLPLRKMVRYWKSDVGWQYILIRCCEIEQVRKHM